MPIIRVDLDEAHSEFITAYGEALLKWSYIENRLYLWFRTITGMSDQSARAIFFSARSFTARADMMNAIIAVATFKGAVAVTAKEFIKNATGKAAGYAGLRNAIAHGRAIKIVNESGSNAILVQGDVADHLQAGITAKTLNVCGKNFASLSSLLEDGLLFYRSGHRRRLQECLETMLMLPNEANCSEPSQKQLGQKQQRQAARRKKAREERKA